MMLVLDTNVVLDWLVFEDPKLNPLRETLRRRRVTILSHQQALDELCRVLARRELGLDPARRQWVLEQYQAGTSRWPPGEPPWIAPAELPERFPRCADPDDDHFLAFAWHSKADVLASRDKAVLALARKCAAFGFSIMDVPQLIAAIK